MKNRIAAALLSFLTAVLILLSPVSLSVKGSVALLPSVKEETGLDELCASEALPTLNDRITETMPPNDEKPAFGDETKSPSDIDGFQIAEADNEAAAATDPETDCVPDAQAAEAEAETSSAPQAQTAVPSIRVSPSRNASVLSLGAPVSGSLKSTSDAESYSFAVTGRGKLTVQVGHEAFNDNSGWKVTLYSVYYENGTSGKSSLRELNVLYAGGDTLLDLSPAIGVYGGKYEVVVERGKSFTKANYSLTVSFTPSVSYEIECNDNIFRYTEVYDGVPIRGTASKHDSSYDVDWYMLRVYEPSRVSLNFSHAALSGSSVAFKVTLSDESGKSIYSGNSYMGSVSIASGSLGLTPGNYYICVSNRVYTDTEYTLSVGRSVSTQFEAEPNDGMTTATKINDFGAYVTGSMSDRSGGYDTDYYSFELSSPGYVNLTFEHPELANPRAVDGWNIAIADSSGVILFSDICAWNETEVLSPEIGLGVGVYYVVVDCNGRYFNPADYRIKVDFTRSSSREAEPNDTFETACYLPEGLVITGAIGVSYLGDDEDFYTFSLEDSQNVCVEFEHESTSVNGSCFELTLYDKNGKAVADSDNIYLIIVQGASGSVMVEYNDLPAGEYYIKITPATFVSHGNYRLCYSIM